VRLALQGAYKHAVEDFMI